MNRLYKRIATISTLLSVINIASATPPPSIFNIVRPLLAQKSKLPIVLPPATSVRLLLHFNRQLTASNIGFITDSAYSLNFDLTDNCHGAPPCSIGNFFASSLHTHPTPPNDSQSFPLSAKQIHSLKTIKPLKSQDHHTVRLDQTHLGYIERRHSTGVGSSLFRTLTWVNNNCVFQLTLKGVASASMIKLAQATLKIDKKTSKIPEIMTRPFKKKRR